jgi:hypothetical protein
MKMNESNKLYFAITVDVLTTSYSMCQRHKSHECCFLTLNILRCTHFGDITITHISESRIYTAPLEAVSQRSILTTDIIFGFQAEISIFHVTAYLLHLRVKVSLNTYVNFGLLTGSIPRLLPLQDRCHTRLSSYVCFAAVDHNN